MSCDFDAIVHALTQHSGPVILLEGTRQVPPEQTACLRTLAERLAVALPRAVFRSGNAQGADHAFFSGLRYVPAERLEIVLPYPGSGAKRLPPSGRVISLAEVPTPDLPGLAATTLAASPSLDSMIHGYLAYGRKRHTAAAMYLLRDTLKVTGNPALGLAPADLGFFFVNEQAPDSGGTGHTMRVCRHLGVPVITQDAWRQWAAPSVK